MEHDVALLFGWVSATRFSELQWFLACSDIAMFEYGNGAVLCERGEYEKNNKGEHYDESGYTVISIGGAGGTATPSP